jgi:hypothetical protein
VERHDQHVVRERAFHVDRPGERVATRRALVRALAIRAAPPATGVDGGRANGIAGRDAQRRGGGCTDAAPPRRGVKTQTARYRWTPVAHAEPARAVPRDAEKPDEGIPAHRERHALWLPVARHLE